MNQDSDITAAHSYAAEAAGIADEMPVSDLPVSNEPASAETYIDVVTEAATLGNMLSAKYRLGQLYRSGEGVDADRAEAIRWYSLAALQALSELSDDPSIARAETVYSILFDLGELHYETGDSQRAISTFLRLESVLDSLYDELSCYQMDRWLQICSNKLGGLYERTARPDRAYTHFSRALGIAEKAAAENECELTLDDLAVACYRVGFIDHLFREERTLLDRAYRLWKNLYEQTGNYDYRRKWCVIDTLYATSDIPSPEPQTEQSEQSQPTADEISEPAEQPFAETIEPAADTSAADAMAAELAEYIREHGYSKSTPFDGMRPLLETAGILALIALCLWAYFSGTFHEIFRFIRNL